VAMVTPQEWWYQTSKGASARTPLPLLPSVEMLMTAFLQPMSAWADMQEVAPAGSLVRTRSLRPGTVELHHQALVFTLSMALEVRLPKINTQLTSLHTKV